jgi:hypothetical protein
VKEEKAGSMEEGFLSSSTAEPPRKKLREAEELL